MRTEAKAQRAFQGWRYLRPEEAPPDLGACSEGADPGGLNPGETCAVGSPA